MLKFDSLWLSRYTEKIDMFIICFQNVQYRCQ